MMMMMLLLLVLGAVFEVQLEAKTVKRKEPMMSKCQVPLQGLKKGLGQAVVQGFVVFGMWDRWWDKCLAWVGLAVAGWVDKEQKVWEC